MVPLREHFLPSESALQPPPPFARLRISPQRSNASRETRRFPGLQFHKCPYFQLR